MEAIECQMYDTINGCEQQQQQKQQHTEYAGKVKQQKQQQKDGGLKTQAPAAAAAESAAEHKVHVEEEEDDDLPMFSPTKVGHEFVKQYYRMLFKAPEILFRFYTNESTCTHHDYGMVIGKHDIRCLFQRENYRKCRTNIFNIDIHGTIANGVIVLVTGERANAGHAMRPFVQTFVLAAEGPRKYYVSNDIFRYADVFEKSTTTATTTTPPPRTLVDVECQTSSLHIGDGDRRETNSESHHHHSIEQSVGILLPQPPSTKVQQQQQQQQQVYDYYKSTTTVESCAIPMPRWASARQSRDSSVSGHFTSNNNSNNNNYTQQEENFVLQENGDGNINENLTLSDFATTLEQEQQQQQYPYYRSIIANALSPRMEFEEISPGNNNPYVNTVYYNEDNAGVQRASVGVSSLKVPKFRTEQQKQQQQQQQLYARSSNEDQSSTPSRTTESQESHHQAPTYAKLFMNALTRAGMKNNNNNSMTSSISSPMKATNMPNLFNAPRSSNNETNPTSPSSIVTTKTTASNQAMHAAVHQQQQQQECNNFAPVTGTQDYSHVQRNNNNNSNNNYGGMRRNEKRRSSSAQKYDDNQQLFLGQIPHNATEEELIRIFSCFGNVLELRILPNLNGKIQPGAKHPLKYGFLTFEHVESVKACLESRPVYFPNNLPDGQKLNVRAKKPAVSRDETNSNSNNNNSNNNNNNGCHHHSQLDSQSLGSEWLKATTRRHNSISSNSTNGSNGGGSGGGGGGIGFNNVFNRKENRNGRAVSLDSGTTTAPNSGNRKFAQVAAGGGVVNGCGRR